MEDPNLNRSISLNGQTCKFKSTSSEAPASLAPSSGDSLTQHYRQHLKSLLNNDNNQLPLRTSVPYRDITSEFLYTAIPAGVVFVLTALVLLGKS